MNQKTLYALWGGMFILCAGLGFIPEPTGALQWLLTALSVSFFIPPFLLLHKAHQAQDRAVIQLIRNLSALSLLLTLVLLLVNFLSLMAPEILGNLLYILLVIVSAPMVCAQYWVLSLFLWACLLMVTLKLLRRKP